MQILSHACKHIEVCAASGRLQLLSEVIESVLQGIGCTRAESKLHM